jgi:hypothetical protein
MAACGGKPAAARATTPAASGATTTTTEQHGPSLADGQADANHPSPLLTPGATFAGVTADQVCVSGYSASVRDVPSSERDQVFAEYGLSTADRSQYEVDHLIALELGGSNDVKNLWPEPKSGTDNAITKDSVENRLHDLVCNGQVSLTDAQALVVHWDTADIPTPTTAAPTTTTAPPPPPTVTVPPVTVPPATLPPAPPATEPPVSDTSGPTALCNDGTYSYAAHHQGACSHHGGVAEFYK